MNYIGGYFLVKRRFISHNIPSYTCSGCINTLAFDHWSFDNDVINIEDDEKQILNLDDRKIIEINNWTKEKENNNLLISGSNFSSLDLAKEYKKLFFNKNDDILILRIDFSQEEKNSLIEDFNPGSNEDFNFNDGYLGLRSNLLKNIESSPKVQDKFLGYDLIGVEGDGSFHSFHCHDLANQLKDEFNIELNNYGLIKNIPNDEELTSYLNDPEVGLEPVPWYIVEVYLEE